MFQYTNPHVPTDYRCGTCGAEGCKLWRVYGTFLDCLELRCAVCACANTDARVEDIDDRGMIPLIIQGRDYGRTDQINGLIPAVPTECGTSYWGYTSVPDLGVAWWRALPLKPKDPNP